MNDRQHLSIFNDILGPVMIGPSSSHTAASVRIGRMLRQMAGGAPAQVTFTFSTRGNMAATYMGQGSAMGLAAGLMNMDSDDPHMVQALELIKKTDTELTFVINDQPVDHPSTYQAAVSTDDLSFTAEFISTGGGMITLKKINDISVDIDGGAYDNLYLTDKRPDMNILTGLYDQVMIWGNTRQGYIIDIRSDKPLEDNFLPFFTHAVKMHIEPVFPVINRYGYGPIFLNGQELVAYCNENNCQPWEAALDYESQRGSTSREHVLELTEHLVGILRSTLDSSRSETEEYTDRILPRQAHLLERSPFPGNDFTTRTIQYVTWFMEAKSSMKPFVAIPTAGSCGVVPGTLMAAVDIMDLPEEELIKSFLVAGLMGVLIGERCTLSGEVGGCQVECGVASGMAAGGLIQLLGGSVEQVVDATSMALQNIIGLSCDPVADRVEVPCLGKNIMCSNNAVSMANVTMAGFDKVVPLDETIDALSEVAQLLPPCICNVGSAGLSVTETSRRIWKELNL